MRFAQDVARYTRLTSSSISSPTWEHSSRRIDITFAFLTDKLGFAHEPEVEISICMQYAVGRNGDVKNLKYNGNNSLDIGTC